MNKYKTIAKELGFKWDAITGPCKYKEIVDARRIIARAMYADWMNYIQIARNINRSHTTVMNLVDDDFHARKLVKSREGHSK